LEELEGLTMKTNALKLSEVPRRLRLEFDIAISYRRLYQAVLDASIPAFKDKSGTRWFVNSADLRLIVNRLAPAEVKKHD
jgi:hypothetical protein